MFETALQTNKQTQRRFIQNGPKGRVSNILHNFAWKHSNFSHLTLTAWKKGVTVKTVRKKCINHFLHENYPHLNETASKTRESMQGSLFLCSYTQLPGLKRIYVGSILSLSVIWITVN